MPTIHREDGFSFRVYPNDHDPPHVHVRRAGEFAKISIGDQNAPPEAMDPGKMGTKDVRKAIRIAERNQAQFLAAWREHHA